MSHSVEWDVEGYRAQCESAEQWELRKAFLEKWKDQFPEDRLVCLSRVFTNMEFLGCRYPAEVMRLVAELSKEVAADYREKKKSKLQRTFVSASDAAEDRARGVKRPANDQSNSNARNSGPKIFVPAQTSDRQHIAEIKQENSRSNELINERVSFECTQNVRPSFGNGGNNDRPSFGNGGSNDRPSFGNGGNNDRPSFDNGGNNNRPLFAVGSDERPSSDNRNNERPHFDNRRNNDRPSFNNRNNDRPSFDSKRNNYGSSYDNRGNNYGPSFDNRGNNYRSSFDNTGNSDRPSFDNRRNDDGPSFYNRGDNDRPPFRGKAMRGSNRRRDKRNNLPYVDNSLIETEYGNLVLFDRPGTFANKLFSSCQRCRAPMLTKFSHDGPTWLCSILIKGLPAGEGEGLSQREAKEAACGAAWRSLGARCHTLVVRAAHSAGDRISAQEVAGASVSGPSRLEEGLDTKVDSAIATRMMEMMGWSGGALGSAEDGISEPIVPHLKQIRRMGLGNAGSGKREINTALQSAIEEYARDGTPDYDLVFASDFTKEERADMHKIALRCGLRSKSYGKDEERYLVITKPLALAELVQNVISSGGSNEKYQLILPTGNA